MKQKYENKIITFKKICVRLFLIDIRVIRIEKIM